MLGHFGRMGYSHAHHGVPAAAFTPASLSPNLWVEPGRGGLFQSNAGTTAATIDTNPVGYLPDLSGNTFTLTSVADDTTRPTLQGVGSFPYLSFDGSNDILRRTAALDGWNANAATWCFTLRSNSNAVNTCVAGNGRSSSSSPVYSLIYASTATAANMSAWFRDDSAATPTGAPNQVTPINANVYNGSDHVVLVIDTGSAIQVYIDGVLGTGIASYSHTNTITLDRFAIGGLLRTTAGQFWAGRIYGGVIVNRALDATERGNLTTYMGNLAGLSL
jgi:hypothetical protein